jgi:tetratricopeptide (TPR) repeat protein
MHTLIIHHLGSTGDQHRCQVWRQADGKVAAEVVLSAPETQPVEGRPDSNLSRELRWYLEEFLDYPFPPRTEVAERVQTALKTWGEAAFQALFHSGQERDFYQDAYRSGLENLTLKIASDDPRLLAWPWEALRDPQTSGTLAQHCRMERQLSGQHDPLQVPATLSRERINMLLVTARPYEEDIGFRALSRPLLELIAQDNLPVSVEMLRPPTFAQSRDHLHARPGYYHIVHFDGHGGYGPGVTPDGYRLEGRQGRLLFETDSGEADPVSAEQIGALLREYRIPIMVLNACQSAMIDAEATDAFASVAAALQRAGVRSVVAMAYALYVSGARVFLPAFYRRLFEQGSITEAVRAGRQAMLQQPGRLCYRGTFPLYDWLVPVVYQQDPPDLPFTRRHEASATAHQRLALPPEVTQDSTPHGFIGRDSAMLALERAMQRPPAGILVHGLGGIGKTTLARGFVQCLADTGGLQASPFWFTFSDIHSSAHVINHLVAELFGTAAMAADMPQKLAALTQALRERPLLMVWDNFESVSGIPGTEVQPLLPASDRQQLRDLLYALHGGKTKILLTSRSPETAWLSRTHCYRLPLGGLRGEERWTYCDALLRDLGLTARRDDPHLGALMDFLDGHPLAMRVMLTQLAEHSAVTLGERLRQRLSQTATDEAQAKLFATLSFVEDALPGALRPLLVPLALHERFVDARYLEAMAGIAEAAQSRAALDQMLTSLEIAGVLHAHGQGIYALHPALTGFLRARPSASAALDTAWRRAFVEVMGQLADQVAPKPLHVQRPFFALHSANVHTAFTMAEQAGMDLHGAAIAQALAAYAQHQRDFGQAEQWYRRTLAIKEKLKNASWVADTYHQLGRIAQEQRDFRQAEQWYRRALAIKERLGDEPGAAKTYHMLGRIAQEQHDFFQA